MLKLTVKRPGPLDDHTTPWRGEQYGRTNHHFAQTPERDSNPRIGLKKPFALPLSYRGKLLLIMCSDKYFISLYLKSQGNYLEAR